ncbi:MAG: hypothetical protein VB013_14480 [Anaerolineaceae bacterium]|nr:hypothetical protein [Anaerolineaceae bacterium]
MNSQMYHNNIFAYRRCISSLLIFLVVLTIAACSVASPQQMKTQTSTNPMPTLSPTKIKSSSTFTPRKTNTVTTSPTGPTATLTPWGNGDGFVYPQGTSDFPPNVDIGYLGTPSETYLYYNVRVTFLLSQNNGVGWLDLDHPGYIFTDEDISLVTKTNNGKTSVSLLASGYSRDFFPDERAYQLSGNHADISNYTPQPVGLTFCLDHLSEYGRYKGESFMNGVPVCVLTTTGRIATVQYIQTDNFYNDDGTCNVTLLITVYQKQVDPVWIPTDLPTSTSTLTPSLTPIGYKPTGTIFPTATPTPTVVQHSMTFDEPFTPHLGTPQPVTISHGALPSDTYLYRNELVTFRIYAVFLEQGYGLINLDNLNDNSIENSDIEIGLNIEKHGVIDLDMNVVNGSKDFDWAERQYELTGDEHDWMMGTPATIGYDFCVNHLPEYGYYWGGAFASGEPYCVLTNEGRIATVYRVPVEVVSNDDNTYNITLAVTVYQKKPVLPGK